MSRTKTRPRPKLNQLRFPFAGIIANVLLCSLFSALPASSVVQYEQYKDIKITPKINGTVSPLELRADAKEIAELLGIEPVVLELKKLRGSGTSLDPVENRRLLNKRLVCLWRIQIASQEVRKLVSSIDNDQARSFYVLDSLSGQVGRTTSNIDTLNFAQIGTLGIVKQSLRLGRLPLDATQGVGITLSGTATLLSVLAVAAPQLYKRPVTPPPNVLAHILTPSYRPSDADDSYLWKFFNSPIPGSGSDLTRREVLIRHWDALLGLHSDDRALVKRLIEMPEGGENLGQSLIVVNQRIAILRDFKSHVEEFDAALFQLHKAMRPE